MVRASRLCFVLLPLAACSTGGDGAQGVEPSADAGADAPITSQPDAGESDATVGADAGPKRNELRVSGNHLVNEAGKTVRLFGVNHSSGEFMCSQARGIFESAADDAFVSAIASWHANVVRLPMNEDCWLGINAMDQRYSGVPYRRAVQDLVRRFRDKSIYVILEIHWSAPSTYRADRQQPMLDADHGPDVWKSIAATFSYDRGVVFDLFNEPYLAPDNVQTADPWACWRDGCAISKANVIPAGWASAGTQSLVDAVRSTGAKNVILLGGLAYANDLSDWLGHRPQDPEGQLAASFHVYNFTACNNPTCWDGPIASVAAQVPLVTTEIGEDDCAHGFIDGYMSWADAHGVSYLGWTWNAWNCGQGPALVLDMAGTPTPFGQGLRDHFMIVAP